MNYNKSKNPNYAKRSVQPMSALFDDPEDSIVALGSQEEEDLEDEDDIPAPEPDEDEDRESYKNVDQDGMYYFI